MMTDDDVRSNVRQNEKDFNRIGPSSKRNSNETS